jgi:hypothetical protein
MLATDELSADRLTGRGGVMWGVVGGAWRLLTDRRGGLGGSRRGVFLGVIRLRLLRQ